MIIKRVETKHALKAFYQIGREVYRDNVCHRSTEDDVMRLLIEGPTAFHRHASVIPCIMYEGTKVVGRCAFINDQKLADYVQVSFFEALPGLDGIVDCILEKSRSLFPQCRRVVIGLNGHLNYGAGILLNHFDEPPVFGLPYTPPYYPEYFKSLDRKTMISYHFPTKPFIDRINDFSDTVSLSGITIRNLSKKVLRRDIEIYTYLNNTCFRKHPLWADRTSDEDYELFYPFRFFIKEENLLFAELNGEVIGFLLWYPDFNQLVRAKQHLGLIHLLRYYFVNPISTCRFTQIAVVPRCRKKPVAFALIRSLIHQVRKTRYIFAVGGYIFEENKNSMAMSQRYFERIMKEKLDPYHRYAVFISGL